MDIFFDNEFRSLIPPLQPDELSELEKSLKTEGNRDPVVIWKEKRLMLDGHHRYDICTAAGIALKPALELSFPDRESATLWIIDNQLGRRNLPPYDRIGLVKLRAEIVAKKDQAGQRKVEAGQAYHKGRPKVLSTRTKPLPPPIDVRKEIAVKAKVGVGTVARYDIVEKKATPEQKAKLRAGKATINQVYVAIRRDEAKEQVKTMQWPIGKYRIFYADPAWEYGNTQPDYHEVQDDHYPTMTVENICKLPVSDLALSDAVLFLWATSPILEESFSVINAWGFKYKASFVWDKIKHNMGHYNSVRHEFLLIAVRGSCQPEESKLFDSVQSIERTEHSAKPEKFREIIDTLYPHGPRIELFAREKHEGWETYGNQIGEC